MKLRVSKKIMRPYVTLLNIFSEIAHILVVVPFFFGGGDTGQNNNFLQSVALIWGDLLEGGRPCPNEALSLNGVHCCLLHRLLSKLSLLLYP